MLGFGPVYHMREVAKNGHQEQWVALIKAKFFEKGNLSQELLEAPLKGYQV